MTRSQQNRAVLAIAVLVAYLIAAGVTGGLALKIALDTRSELRALGPP